MMAVAAIPVCASAAIFYVDGGTGDDANDGSEQHPFKTPCYALSMAAHMDEVRFYPGVYMLTNTPTLRASSVTLKGLGTSRDDVVFDAGGQFRCLDTSPADALPTSYVTVSHTTLDGITFRNGYCDKTKSYNNWGFGFGAGVRLINCYGNAQPEDFSTITNCAFVANTNAFGYGGALNAGGGATIVDCLFKDNFAGTTGTYGGESGGGALHLQPASKDVNIIGCTFENNVASNGFSVIASGSWQATYQDTESGINLRGCTFRGNRGLNYESASVKCPVLGVKVRLAENCTFVSNRTVSVTGTGTSNGGVLNIGGSVRTNRFVGCEFLGNAAAGKGGALFASGACNLHLTNCTFTANEATDVGSAICCDQSGASAYSLSKVLAADCSFIGNRSTCDTAPDRGGVLTVGMGSRLDRCTFIGNESYGQVGVLQAIASTNIIVSGCEFRANVLKANASGKPSYSAVVRFGGITDISGPEFRNCLFACNTNLDAAVKSRAFWLFGQCGNVFSSTFVGNRSAEAPEDYSVMLSNSIGYYIRNCLFADNRSLSGVATHNNINSYFIEYSAEDGDTLKTTGAYASNIIGANMRFLDAEAGDYRITRRSPGVDQGILQDWMSGAKDFGGVIDRIVNSVPDFGCYEYYPGIDRGFVIVCR